MPPEPHTIPAEVAWGGPQDMSAWEALMWRAEGDLRTSSTGILLEILEAEPDWDRFVAAHRRTVARIPRLRERVVEPVVPVVQPAWSGLPDFEVHDHLQRVRLAELAHGNDEDRTLLDYCEALMKRPLDPSRPPWEGTLVTGLADGRAAYLFRFHHSLTDGMGLIQLLSLAHAPEGSQSGLSSDDPVVRPVLTPRTLLRSRLAKQTREAPAQGLTRLRTGLKGTARLLSSPAETVRGALTFTESLRRMLAGPDTTGSPLFTKRSVGSRFLTMDVDLDALRFAAKAANGSLNDAFLAAVLGAARLYHERAGVMVDTIPVAMPVSMRKENDPLGGNRFAGARLPGPLSETDPAERIRIIRDLVLEVREEPALGFLDYLSPTLTKLPTSAIVELSASITSASDLQISNIKGLGHGVSLAGQRVLGMYPLGPRPGVAAMVAMISYDGVCCLGLNVDPNLFPDITILEECLKRGFDEVLALGRTEGADR